jgi:methylase of polypeptide subunit release factors
MTRPFESDQYLTAFGSSLEYRSDVVLMSDAVTDGMAYVAASIINSEGSASRPRILELGVGAGPFLSQVLAHTKPTDGIELEGVDIAEGVFPFAEYNVEKQLAKRNNPFDSFVLSRASYGDILRSGQRYDFIYANFPYLAEGEQVRPSFRDAPFSSMYVAGSLDGLEHFREVIPKIASNLNAGGRLFIRMPRDSDKIKEINAIVSSSFQNTATIHQVEVEAELGERSGGGVIVEMAGVAPQVYRVAPVRVAGMALQKIAA